MGKSRRHSAGSLLVSLFENLLEGNRLSADEYLNRLIGIIELEDNQLLLNLMLRQVRILYWNFLSEAARADAAVNVEKSLWALMLAADSPSSKKIFFEAYRDLALTDGHLISCCGFGAQRSSLRG